jgi:CBS domain-containing protein
MKVSDLLSKKDSTIHQIAPNTKLLDAIKKLNKNNIGALIVTENEQLAGIITERDVLHAVENKDINKLKVEDIMTKKLLTGTKEDTTDDVMNVMTVNHIRHLPILENDVLIGIISIGDIVKTQLQRSKAEAEHLKDYIHGRR